MTDFKPAYPDTVNLDPHKRVYYSHGLVLGVDEFLQEETYLLERDRTHNRGLHGYGTVCGLSLDTRDDGGQPDILVGPGVAVDPRGREVRVPEAQCARLDDWLLRHHDDVVGLLGSPPSSSPAQLVLNLVLCYAECPTDEVPVPSGPCQSLERTMVPSRVADDFRLELRTDLGYPEQIEEGAVRDLIALLDAIPVSDTPGGMTDTDMTDLIRGLIPGGSPPVVSPPTPTGHMQPTDVPELVRTAFRVWVTDVRPELLAGQRNCAGGPPLEECILLARVEFPVEDTDAGLRVSGLVSFDESERPYLLHTRLLQEYLGACCTGAAGSGGGGGGGGGALHVAGTETVTGSKSFAAPIVLTGAGRVRRHIELAAGDATTTYADTTRLLTFRALPVVRFTGSGGPTDYQGAAVFNLALPYDLDPTEPLRARLTWFFDVLPTSPPTPPAPQYAYSWELRHQFFVPGEHLPQTLNSVTPVTFADNVPVGDEFNLLMTDYQTLAVPPAVLAADGAAGALHVKMGSFNPPDARLFLVKVELDYVANRLGRAMS